LEIIHIWPENVHIPGCAMWDLESYCLECHTLAYNALTELKRRRES